MATTMKGIIGGGGLTISASPATISIPTGSMQFTVGTHEFTVPAGVTVIKVAESTYDYALEFVGVTPLTKHSLYVYTTEEENPDDIERPIILVDMECRTHDHQLWGEMEFSDFFTLYWSPEINKHTPTIKDY